MLNLAEVVLLVKGFGFLSHFRIELQSDRFVRPSFARLIVGFQYAPPSLRHYTIDVLFSSIFFSLVYSN